MSPACTPESMRPREGTTHTAFTIYSVLTSADRHTLRAGRTAAESGGRGGDGTPATGESFPVCYNCFSKLGSSSLAPFA